jgi:DNA polymerase-1
MAREYVDRNFFMRTHKALNSLLQGSAADLIKKAMVRVFHEVVDWQTIFLHLTVHDELCLSVPQGADGIKAAKHVQQCMEDFKLRVPIKAEPELGPSWGQTTTLDKLLAA